MDFSGFLKLKVLINMRGLCMVYGVEILCGCLGSKGRGDILKGSRVQILFSSPTTRDRTDASQKERCFWDKCKGFPSSRIHLKLRGKGDIASRQR